MLRMGTIFGRYRIEAVAGSGGMGVVYRATDTETGQPVALKVVSSIRTLDEENRERLLREAQLVARIDHPGVVPVYEAGEHDGHFYLAMLWVDGSDLEQLLSDLGPLPIERAVEVVANVADALDAAHERGFVHRDVKPANVLVADSGQVYLSDFGLTKVLDASTGLTHTGQLLGTVDYVAPEQIEGRPVDGRADVYSLGGLAYRAITGSVPFDRPGGVARLWAHLNVPAPSLRAKRPDAPRALDAAIRKALAKSPEERFATAGAFAIAAREALGEMAPAAVESGGIEEKVPVLAGAAGPMWEWEPPTAVEETSERSGRTVSLPFGRVRAPMALGLGYAMVVATVLGGVVLSGSGEKVQEVAAGAGKVSLQPSGTSEGSSSSPLAVAEPYILRAKPSGGGDAGDATASAASTETVTVPAAMNRAQRRAAARAEARSEKKSQEVERRQQQRQQRQRGHAGQQRIRRPAAGTPSGPGRGSPHLQRRHEDAELGEHRGDAGSGHAAGDQRLRRRHGQPDACRAPADHDADGPAADDHADRPAADDHADRPAADDRSRHGHRNRHGHRHRHRDGHGNRHWHRDRNRHGRDAHGPDHAGDDRRAPGPRRQRARLDRPHQHQHPKGRREAALHRPHLSAAGQAMR